MSPAPRTGWYARGYRFGTRWALERGRSEARRLIGLWMPRQADRDPRVAEHAAGVVDALTDVLIDTTSLPNSNSVNRADVTSE